MNIDLTAKSLKKQMEIASRISMKGGAIIFAPKEFAEKNVILRNMEHRTEKQISLDELITDPKKILGMDDSYVLFSERFGNLN